MHSEPAVDELPDLLAQAGLPHTPDDIVALVRGAAAAPEGVNPDAWITMLGRDVPERLKKVLRNLRTTLAVPYYPLGDVRARVATLRAELTRRGLDGFVIPRSDEYQNEYVPARAQRLAWITGFTGSAGMAAVLAKRAAIFVDGRYTLQAQAEVPSDLFDYKHLIDNPLGDWLTEALPQGGKLGYDPWLHTVGWVERTSAALKRIGGTLVPCDVNLIDAIWTDQPSAPLTPVVPYDIRFAGRSSQEKRAELAEELAQESISAAVLTQPDSIAWLLNIRGGDVPHTPLPLSFALLRDTGEVDLFIDRRKLTPELGAHLGNAVHVRSPDEFAAALDALGRAKVQIDTQSASAWIVNRLEKAGATLVRTGDPCTLAKACKNEVELAGIRAAHRRDGVAVTRFLHWLSINAPKGNVTELDAAAQLLAFRSEGELFRDQSFEPIAGAGPNGAIVHYHSSPATNRLLDQASLFLIDSGGQYLDGTTDITRTVAIGQPSPEMREHFTRVLKGHIAIATARFPRGTTGAQLDALARQPLWEVGLDFDHGTGHGVGCYLGVHEGPQRISKAGGAVLQSGMVLSNEPGYYKVGAYGIRIENLIAVKTCTDLPNAERPMLDFETLTLAPFDMTLIEPTLLRPAEVMWLNTYHQRVRDTLTPLLPPDVANWLTAVTAPMIL